MAAAVAATMIVPHTSSQQELLDNALFMQREAIATNRKNRFLTTDYKENKFFKPVHQISRRVDQAGTEENLAARGGAMKALTAWNAAYKDLEDDGTAEPDLGKVNEGMGQTHRGKLQENEDLKAYNPANEISFPGNHRGRGIRGGQFGGRGGGLAGNTSGRSERAALVKRSRTVKGSPTTSQPLAKASTRAKPASPMKHTTSTRSNGQVAGNGHAPTSKQARARSPVRPPPTKAPSRERSRPRANFAGQLATPADFMASVRRPQTPSVTTVQPVTQPRLASEAVVKSEALPEARTIVDSPKNLNARQRAVDTDLIDFDDDQPTPRQATIDFTHPSEEATKVKDASSKPNTLTDPVVVTFAVLEAIIHYVKELDTIGISYQLSTQQLQSVTSLLTKQQLQIVADWYDHEELNMLQRYAAKELETRVAAEKAKAVVHNKPAKPSAYTPADMLALRPKTGVSSAKIASATRSPRPKLATTPAEPSQTQDIVPSPTLSVAVTSPGSESTSVQAIAIQSAAYRAYIVGEHIHKSRYQRPSSSSTAESGELRSADDAKSQPVAPPVKMTGPSLPAHLAGHPPVTDHGAAMRQQYGVTTARPTSSVFPHLRDRTNIENQVVSSSQPWKSTAEGPPDVSSRGRGILSASNGHLRAFAADEAAQPPAKPATTKTKTSMLNKTGFVGLRENRRLA